MEKAVPRCNTKVSVDVRLPLSSMLAEASDPRPAVLPQRPSTIGSRLRSLTVIFQVAQNSSWSLGDLQFDFNMLMSFSTLLRLRQTPRSHPCRPKLRTTSSRAASSRKAWHQTQPTQTSLTSLTSLGPEPQQIPSDMDSPKAPGGPDAGSSPQLVQLDTVRSIPSEQVVTCSLPCILCWGACFDRTEFGSFLGSFQTVGAYILHNFPHSLSQCQTYRFDMI